MSSELIINSSRDKSRIGLLKDKKLVEFHQESDETKFNVGDIYVGKVKKINKSHELDEVLQYGTSNGHTLKMQVMASPPNKWFKVQN